MASSQQAAYGRAVADQRFYGSIRAIWKKFEGCKQPKAKPLWVNRRFLLAGLIKFLVGIAFQEPDTHCSVMQASLSAMPLRHVRVLSASVQRAEKVSGSAPGSVRRRGRAGASTVGRSVRGAQSDPCCVVARRRT